jgi:hypothetical protein
MSDGKVQPEEHDTLMQKIKDGIEKLGADLSYSEIVFKLYQKDHSDDVDFLYSEGIKNINLGKHHLTDILREKFIEFTASVAEAYNSVENNEERLLTRFKNDVKNL